VDGGNSKTDVALVGHDGSVLGLARGTSGSYHAVGMRHMLDTIAGTIRAAAVEGGLDPDAVEPEVGVYCLAGADLPVDDRRLGRALGRAGLAAATIVRNDAFAGLRAGTTEGWGISLVCGTGLNCAGVSPTGRTVRFAALGAASGDEGGGADLAARALIAAIHARDGRGPRTALERLVPGHFGLRRPIDVVNAIHVGRIREADVLGLAPVVFAAAIAGDGVARGLVDWLADQVVAMGASAIRRLGLTRQPVEVVFIGSIWKTDDRAFHERVETGLLAVAQRAVLRRLEAPPVLGAALLGADRLGLGTKEEALIRAQLTTARLERAVGTRNRGHPGPSRRGNGRALG
jgi:N-acetylglucosamine kinase-like BadF-type ATPase